MRGSVVLACGALAAVGACLDIPEPPDGPPGPPPSIDFTIELGTEGGQYPVQITVDGQGLLAESEACGDEGGFGLGVLPDFVVDGRGLVSGTRLDVLGGPVHKVVLDWLHGACDVSNMVTGHTMLTWFPDGHIVRFDTLFQDAGGSLEATACHACSGEDHWFLTAFAAFADVDRMELANGSPFQNQAGGTGTDIPGSQMCVTTTTDRRIAFQWNTDADARARTIFGNAIAFPYDIVVPAASQNGISFGNLPTTHMMVATDATTCTELLTRLDRFAHAPGDLEINGTVDHPSYQDGIFGSEEEDRYIVSTSGPITLRAQSAITGGFAVLLQFPEGGPANLVANGLDPADYDVMTVTPTDRVVWFRAGMPSGTDLVLMPQ